MVLFLFESNHQQKEIDFLGQKGEGAELVVSVPLRWNKHTSPYLSDKLQ